MQRALAIDEKSYGPEHPEVARLNNLAALLKGRQPRSKTCSLLDLAVERPVSPSPRPRFSHLRSGGLSIPRNHMPGPLATTRAFQALTRVARGFPANPTHIPYRSRIPARTGAHPRTRLGFHRFRPGVRQHRFQEFLHAGHGFILSFHGSDAQTVLKVGQDRGIAASHGTTSRISGQGHPRR